MKRYPSFKGKLLAAFIICTLIPLLLLSAIMVKFSQVQLDLQEKSYIEQQVECLAKQLDVISDGLNGIAKQLNRNQTVETAFTGQNVDETKIYNLLYSGTKILRNFATLGLYNLDGELKYSTSGNYESETLYPWWGILNAAKLRDGIPVFQTEMFRSNKETTLFRGAVLLKNRADEPIGYIVLTMHQQDFYNLFDGKLRAQDNVLIMNQFYHPVYASSNFLLKDIGEKIRNYMLNENRIYTKSDNYLLEMQEHKATKLNVILISQRIINNESLKVLYIISGICALIGIVISIGISIPVRNQIFAPIQKLQKAFNILGKGNLDIQLQMAKTEEMNQLYVDFNKMVNALSDNQKILLQNQKDLDNAHIHLLQTQLNPHFLCNTLDTIKWISKMNNVPQIGEISANLADILRFCLIPDQYVPFYKEIEIIKLYIEIQKIRLSDNFSFNLTVPEELELCIVPKMLLQPIVENSIIHGFEDRENCSIEIYAYKNSDCLIIKVIDNGCGIPEHMIGKINRQTPSANGHHLGLNNINTIIEKHYGKEYGIYLSKGQNSIGTIVTIFLPIVVDMNNG